LLKKRSLYLHNILIIDNKISNLKALERILRSEYNVYLTTNKEDSLIVMEQRDIALVILEYNMIKSFESSGNSLLDSFDAVKVVVADSFNEGFLKEAVELRQIFGYVIKPWEPEEIKSIVAEGIKYYSMNHTAKEPYIRVLLHSGVISKEQLEAAIQAQKDQEEPLENIILEMELVSVARLEVAKEIQKSGRKPLSQILIETGAISPEELELARKKQKHKRKTLTELIIQLGFADEESVYSCYSLQLGIPYMSLAQFSKSSLPLKTIPAKLACRYNIIPVDLVGKVVVLTALEPLSDDAKSEITEETGYKIMTMCSARHEMEPFLEEYCIAAQEQDKTQDILDDRAIEVELDGTVRFLGTDDALDCIILSVREDYNKIGIFASDPRICAKESVELKIFLPVDTTPISCSGKITYYSEADDRSFKSNGFLAQVSIESISKSDLRRFELALDRIKTVVNN
jgi:hypothetical protein